MKILNILQKILPKIIITIPILYFIISYFIIKVIPGEDVNLRMQESIAIKAYNINFALIKICLAATVISILGNIFNKKSKITKTYLHGLGLFFVSSVIVAGSYEFTFHSGESMYLFSGFITFIISTIIYTPLFFILSYLSNKKEWKFKLD